MTQGQFNHENQRISNLLQAVLPHLEQNGINQSSNAHLDEDSLSAFVEGSLTRRESAPVLRHLVGCTPCRRITAQLVRLAEELGDLPETTPALETQTSRLREFLSNFVTRNFGFSDEAVFAHNAESEDEKTDGEDEDNAKGVEETSNSKE